MTDGIHHYTLQFSQLQIDLGTVLYGLGYKDGTAPLETEHAAAELLLEAEQHAEIECGFVEIPPNDLTIVKESVCCRGTIMETGKLITARFRKSTSMFVYVTTAGAGIDKWSRALHDEGDFLKSYIVDSIGSEIAEKTAEWLEEDAARIAGEKGLKTTNRYSPGYCEWTVAGQHALFSLLPAGFCHISLTESALMIPKKSTSGLIGAGPNAVKEMHQCSICDLGDCIRRR